MQISEDGIWVGVEYLLAFEWFIGQLMRFNFDADTRGLFCRWLTILQEIFKDGVRQVNIHERHQVRLVEVI